MMRLPLLVATSLFAGLCAAQSFEIPRPTVGYSATQTMQVPGFAMETEVAYEDGKQRSEMNMMGQNMFTIVRQDLEVVWIGMPGGMYMETPYGEKANVPGQQDRMPSFAEFKDALVFEVEGKETIEGFPTTRYHYVVEDPDSGQVDGRAWLTEQNIPIQFVATAEMDGQPTEVKVMLRNLKLGDQPDELFELPAGAQKFSLGGIPGFGGGGSGPFGGFGDAGAAGAAAEVDGPAQTEPSLTDEVVDAAADGARDAVVDEARDGASDVVRGGFRRLRDALRK